MYQNNSDLSIYLYTWALSPLPPFYRGLCCKGLQVRRQPGNAFSLPTSRYANATSPITYHESRCLVNKEMERARGEGIWRRRCRRDTHAEQYGVHVHASTCAQAPARLRTDSIAFTGSFRFLHFHSAAAHIPSSNPYQSDVNFTLHVHLQQEYVMFYNRGILRYWLLLLRQWFKTDSCLSTNLHIFIVKYETCLKRT